MKVENNIKNRIGNVEIDVNELRELSPKILRLLFSNFYPLKINNDYLLGRYTSTYTGLSKMFDEVQEATIIPYYVLIVNIEENSVSFEKVK